MSPAPVSGLSAPNASECRSTRTVPGAFSKTPRMWAMVSLRFTSSAAFMLKKTASRPSARMRFWTSSASGSVSRRSRCTPKIFMPPAASASAVASPKPLLAPRISAHCCSVMLDWSNRDLPLIPVARLDADLDPLVRQQLRKPFSPFDQYHGLFFKQLFEADGGCLARVVQAIEIDMVDLSRRVAGFRARRRILVNQGEGWARDFFRLGCPQSLHQPLGQGGFSRAQIADEHQDRAPWELARQPFAKRDGLLLRTGPEGGHTAPWPRAKTATSRSRSGTFLPAQRCPARRRGHADRPQRQLPGRSP